MNPTTLRRTLGLSLLALGVAQAHLALAATATPATGNAVEARVSSILDNMSTSEKINFTRVDDGHMIPKLTKWGIQGTVAYDSSMGVHVNNATFGAQYPSQSALAATWSINRAKEFGQAIAYETRISGGQQMLSPGVNLYRTPYGGRAFEYLSGEDPFLGASLGPAVINGIQARGVWAEAKHFAANDQETNRFTLDESIPERILREITLPPFESAAKNGKVSLMMCSFQEVNGDHACESSHLIRDILKDQWGFTGFVQTDYGAIIDGLKAAQAGTDIDMLFGTQMNATVLTPSINSGVLSVATINDKVRRILRQIYLFDFDTYVPPTVHDTNSLASNQASLNVAREGIVLLKNQNNLLPLDPAVVKKIAVVGVLGKYAPPSGFGSAYASALDYISETSGLAQAAPQAQVTFLDGLSLDPAAVTWTHLDADGTTEVPGLTAEYFTNTDWSGTAATTRTDTYVNLNWDSDTNLPTDGNTASTSIRWTGRVTPTVSGEHVFKVRADGVIHLTVNGQQIINNGDGTPLPDNAIPPTIPQYAKITLQAGQAYDVVLEYSRRPSYIASLGGLTGVQMSWASLVAPSDIAGYDAVLVAAGNSNEYEGEGFDHMWELPEFQGQLIQSIASQNPHTIVALHGGTGLKVNDWVDQVGGLLHAFYPGQNGGQALAEILFGQVNPSAKLPISLERNLQDNPLYNYFPQFDNNGTLTQLSYAGDLLLGYRGYEKLGTTPLYPFGYGLSYTQFSYSNISVNPPVAFGNAPIRVSFNVTNTGQRAGAEVAELYVGQRNPRLTRPVKELKGFQKVLLQPGQSQRVTIELNGRSLAYYNPNRNAWVVDADVFTIGVGAASNDIRLRGRVLSPFRQQLSVTSSNPLPLAVQRAVQVTAGGQGPDQTDDVLFTQTQSTAPQVPPAAGSGGSAPGSAP